ncbi:unnamed protein product [Aphis gossypii]|uniref:Nucleosome assembly protein n=1 Tax=Aphis gossypii TaxID=80765 RepID=A0A9P0JAF4_APHGO|nr:unnamed protein product [Aphis gossypii]
MISENDSVESSWTHVDSIKSVIEYFKLKQKNKLTNMSLQVKKRVRALKNLMVSQNEIESKFKDEVYLLRLKYQKEYEPYFNKLTNIVQGKYEPTKGEYSSSSEEEDVEGSKLNEILKLESCEQVPKGIPGFWYVFMKMSPKFRCIVQPCDDQILKHLSGIRYTRSDEYIVLTIEFYFTPNQWFTNDLLTLKFEKQYLNIKRKTIMLPIPPNTDFKITSGCDINWNTGKNVTQNNFTNQGIGDSCNEIVAETESFFNLFNDNSIKFERLFFEINFLPEYFDSIFLSAYMYNHIYYTLRVAEQYSHNILCKQLSDSEDNESD